MSATDEPKGARGAGLNKPSEPANKPTVETEKGRILANLLNTIGEQAQEIERLKRGDFTPAEFQNLCHSKTVQDGFGDFVVGCHEYQQQLFGVSAYEVITEVERLKDAVVDAAVEWHESGREGASHEWFDNSDALSKALDDLISFRDIGKAKEVEANAEV